MHVDTCAIRWAGDTYHVTKIKQGGTYVAMQPIAQGLGLRWERALVALIQDPQFQPQPFFIKADQAQWLWALPLQSLQLWLETVAFSAVLQAHQIGPATKLERMKTCLVNVFENTTPEDKGGLHDHA